MVARIADAAAAYSRASTQGAGGGMDARDANTPSFGSMLEQATQNAIDTLHSGEKASVDGTLGKADLNDVVNAVTNAQVTLQTVVAVRDKVISAYQSILQMPM